MIRRPPRSTPLYSSAASDVYKRQVLGGLRRCEVLGLRMEDLRVGEHRVFIANGKGGHQRLVPVSVRFFVAVQAYFGGRETTRAEHRRGVCGVEGPSSREAVGGPRVGRDPCRRKASSGFEPCDLP